MLELLTLGFLCIAFFFCLPLIEFFFLFIYNNKYVTESQQLLFFNIYIIYFENLEKRKTTTNKTNNKTCTGYLVSDFISHEQNISKVSLLLIRTWITSN